MYSSFQIHFVDYGDDVLMGLDDLHPATIFGDVPILVHRFYIPKLIPLDKNGKWSPIIFNEFKDKLINEMCIMSLDNATIIDQTIDNIFPCSIEPRNLPCDIFNWLLKKRLGFGTDIDENGEEIIYV